MFVSFDIQKSFIRDRRIVSRYERQRTKVLRRFGTIIRREARRKLKPPKKRKKDDKRKKPERSRPGQPPLTHSPEPNLRTILYGFDSRVLVVGPIGLRGAKKGQGPELHEHGKSVMMKIFGVRRRATFPQRPFMQPALIEKQDELGRSIEKFGLV